MTAAINLMSNTSMWLGFEAHMVGDWSQAEYTTVLVQFSVLRLERRISLQASAEIVSEMTPHERSLKENRREK